ncbi:hypothetical protein Rt10032_c12g4948 [Rhodotorula toruloides]|uniref:Uncharacterized protein n=1 Tax=Rhodotorula toruloides TaxID=5286 RepID=A0A511KKP0_RHOTO|nr:hypothetical protein Rt10032_c12g4948 [Rhodotorula toruloides]
MEEGPGLVQADEAATQLVRLNDLHRLLEEESGAGKGRTVIIEFFKQATKVEGGQQVAYTPPDQECRLDESTLNSLETRYPLAALFQSYAAGGALPDTARTIPFRSPRWFESLASTEMQLFERYTFYLRLGWKRFLVLYLLAFVWLFRRQLFPM